MAIRGKLYRKIIFNNPFIVILLLLFILLVIYYFFNKYIETKRKTNKKIVEPLFGKIRRGIKKGFKKATSKISDVASDAAKEAKKVAEETKRAAEEAKRLAEEAAQAIQIQNAIKELNRTIDRTSDIFENIGDGVNELKQIGTSYSNSVKTVADPIKKISK
jgi:hypothetical protein